MNPRPLTRVAFELRVDPALREEYVRRHTKVWASMLQELEASGRRNYSLFLARDSRLFGYYETEDDDAARRYLAGSAIAAEWESEMAPFFLGLDGRADQAMNLLSEIFNLEDQLESSRDSSQPTHSEGTDS